MRSKNLFLTSNSFVYKSTIGFLYLLFLSFFRATKELEEHKVVIENFVDFIPELDKKNIILAPFCGDPSCEEKIKKESTR